MPASAGQIQLDDLLSVCRAGDRLNRALLTEMLGLFIQDNERRMARAIDACGTGDRGALREAVHAIKGSAALVGAGRLRELAAEMEGRIAGGIGADFTAATLRLQDEFTAVVDTLRSRYPDLPSICSIRARVN